MNEETIFGFIDHFGGVRHPLREDILKAIREKKTSETRSLILQHHISGKIPLNGNGLLSYPTYLHEAIRVGDDTLPIVQMLIGEFQFGANDELESVGRPIHMACMAGAHAIVEYLLTIPAVDVSRHVYSYTNATPLTIAISSEDNQLIETLLANDANVDGAGLDNMTPLELSITKGNRVAVDMLVQRGADLNQAIKWCARQSSFDLAADLYDCGAPVDADVFDICLGSAPLIEKILLREGDAMAHTNFKRLKVPLLEAVWYGYTDTAIVLLRHGAWNADHKRSGMNAIELAHSRGNADLARTIEQFVQATPNPGRDSAGATAPVLPPPPPEVPVWVQSLVVFRRQVLRNRKETIRKSKKGH